MSKQNQEGKPTGEEKRRLYVMAFCIALAIELILLSFKGLPYKPTIFGLAIMITAVLFYAYSWIRDR